MPNFTYSTIIINNPAVPLSYSAVTGVDDADDAVGYYGSSDGEGDTTDVGFTDVAGVVTTLDVPNASTADISGVTASGEIFGDYTSTGNVNYAFVVNHGAVDEFGVPFAQSTSLVGVNNAGVIYGDYEDGSDVVHGFVYDHGYKTVDVAGLTATTVTGVNGGGEIVGEGLNSNDVESGFVDLGGQITKINESSSPFISTDIVGVSDAGVILGDWTDINADTHAFLYQNGVVTKIKIPGAVSITPTSISASGAVTGYYLKGGKIHGFVDIDNKIETVDIPGASEVTVNGVNAEGEVYGNYANSQGEQGFVGRLGPTVLFTSAVPAANGTTVDLTGTIDAADASATIAIDDGATQIGAAAANASGAWSTSVDIATPGVHTLTTQVTGSIGNNGVVCLDDAKTSLTAGGQIVVFLGAGDTVSLSGFDDVVEGSDGAVKLNSAQATVTGAGDAVSVSGGSGNSVTLGGNGASGDADSFKGSHASLTLDADSNMGLSGSDDTIAVGASSNAVVKGSGDVVNASVGDGISIGGNGAAGTTDVVKGSNVAIAVAGASSVHVNGSDEGVTVGAHSLLSIVGATNTITLGLGDQLIIDSGLGDLIDAGRNDILTDRGSGTLIDIGGPVGALTIHHFAPDTSGVIDLLNGVGAYATASQAFAGLQSDGAGGERLSLGTSGHIDFAGDTTLTVHNFKIG